MSIKGYSCDGSLMAHDYGFNALICKGSYFHVAFLCMWNSQHAVSLTIEGAQAARVVTSIQAVNQCQISEIVYVSLYSENDNHSAHIQVKKDRNQQRESLDTYTSLRSLTAFTSLPKESSPMHFSWWSSQSMTLLLGHFGQRPPPTNARILHLKSISTIPIPPSRSFQ